MKSRRGTKRTRGWRIARWTTVAVGILLAAWLGFCALVIAHPQATTRPHKADAIVALGPSLDSRVNTAVRLADTLHIGQIAISIGDTSGQAHSGICAQAPVGVTVICFRPTPYDTDGEARELRDLARQYSWHSVIVITATPHISRAHLIIKHCFAGSVQMVPDPAKTTARQWLYQFPYQTGAFAKALVHPAC